MNNSNNATEHEPLSTRERKFVEEYIANGLKRIAAYRIAFGANASYDSTRAAATRLMAKPNVKAEIRAALSDCAKLCRIRADATLREIAAIAFSDIGDVFDRNNELLPLRKIPFMTRRAISSVRIIRERVTRTTKGKSKITTREQMIEVRMHNKVDGLSKLVRCLGLQKEIPAIEVFLAMLPKDLAEALRTTLSGPPGENVASRDACGQPPLPSLSGATAPRPT